MTGPERNNKHLMTDPKGNSETLNVPRGETMGTLRSRENKTHCFSGASH